MQQDSSTANADARLVYDAEQRILTSSDFTSDHGQIEAPQLQHIIMHVVRVPESVGVPITRPRGTLVRGSVAGLNGAVRGPAIGPGGIPFMVPPGSWGASNVVVAQESTRSTVDGSGIGVQYGW